MKNTKKIVLIFILVISAFLNTSCWNYREVEKMGIAAGLAVDKNYENNKYIVTVEIIDTADSEKGNRTISKIYSEEGNTIFEAVRNIISKINRKLFWSHAKVMIISKDIASSGVAPIIDFINRDNEPRFDMWMIISKEKTAREILYNKEATNLIVSYNLNEIMQQQKISNRFPLVNLFKFMHDISAEKMEAMVPQIKIIYDEEKKISKIDGSAVFYGDKLVGWLDGIETYYALLVKGEAKKGVIVVQNVGGTNTNVTLEVFNNKTKLIPVCEDGKTKMKIKVNMEVSIGEILGVKDYADEKARKQLRTDAEITVKRNMEKIINKIQKEYKSDIFGFSQAIQKKQPNYWREIEKQYYDIFSTIETEVSVKIKIRGSAEDSKVIKIGTD